MKTFFNVLYRRILYKIPLKLLLILLAVFAVLFSCVNADVYLTVGGNTEDITNYDGDIYIEFGNNVNYTYDDGREPDKVYTVNAIAQECNYSGYVLESSIDSNYCENNLLCPVYTGECENSSGVNWSSLYINNIQHLGGSNIYIDIPEEYDRDYNYSDSDDMFINIEGYNVDYDKIEGIINTQNYKPTQEDFNNIIGILADYMPIIVIFLGLLFIYSMIKKPFKSKLK